MMSRFKKSHLTRIQLAKLESLAVYFDTDARSLAGMSHQEFIEKFTELVGAVLVHNLGDD